MVDRIEDWGHTLIIMTNTNTACTSLPSLHNTSSTFCSLGGWGRLGFYLCAGPLPRCPERVRKG